MYTAVRSKMCGYSFLNRKLLQTFQRVVLSTKFHTAHAYKPQLCRHFLELNSRNIHAAKERYGDKREWVVTHLAEQELALSALRRLELAVNKLKIVKKSDLKLVLKGNLKDVFVKDKDIIFLIRCCGSLLANESLETRSTLAEALWDKICNSSIQLENEHFTALLKTNLENHKPVSPKQFLSEMKELGVDPNGETLRILLSCVNVTEKSEENMAFVVEEMKSRGFSDCSEFYGTLASVLAEQGNILEAEDIVKSMKKRQADIASSVYASLVKGRIIQGEKEPVLELLAQMEKMGVKLSPMEYTSIVSKLAEVSALPENKSRKLIESVMPRIRIPLDEDIQHRMLNAIVELLHCGKGNAACKLVLSLPHSLQVGGKFDEPLPIVFCKELARADITPEEVLKICTRLEDFMVVLLKREDSLKPFVLHTVIRYALQSAKVDLCLFLLEELGQRGVPLRPHYFWPLLVASAKQESNERRQEEGILKMLKKMMSLGVNITCETLAVYALPFTQPHLNAFEVLTLLQQSGVSGVVCRTAVTQWMLDKGELAEAAKLNDIHQGQIDTSLLVEPLLSCIINKMDQPSSVSDLAKLLRSMIKKQTRNIDYTGHFLLELSKKLGLFKNNGPLPEGQGRDIDYVLKILKVLGVKNIRISSQALDHLMNALSPQLELSEMGQAGPLKMPLVDDGLILPLSEFQPLIPHPRDMDIDELEAHLVELRAKGLNDRGVLRRLLQLHCRKRNLKRALEVKRDMELANHSFSPGMLSSFLDLLIHNNEIEKAEDVFLQLSNHPKFKLDDYKVIDLAALMCKRGRVDEGIAILQRHAEIVRVRPGPSIERNLLNLLLAVHQSGKRVKDNEAKTGERGKGWTPVVLMDELVRLGYVMHPPPASMKTKLKEICGLVLPT